MSELGDLLRQSREARGLTLEQAESATRIRGVYLQALEEGNHEILPHPTFVKGFLRNYALYLGLDPARALSLYGTTGAPETAAAPPRLLDEPLQAPDWRRWWPVAFALLVIALAAAGWWGRNWLHAAVPTATAIATATPTATSVPPSPTSQPPTPTSSPTATSTPTSTSTPLAGLLVRIEVVGQDAWLSVRLDDQDAKAETLAPGTVRTWTARERIQVRCGNAGAVRVTVNGQDLGLLGALGQVVEKEWAAPGIPTRTPQASASPTQTR